MQKQYVLKVKSLYAEGNKTLKIDINASLNRYPKLL